MYTAPILAALIAYLAGAIPFGLIIGRINGIDIREKGSGNIGATNVFRCVGKGWGITAFLLDFAKGLTAATLIPLLVSTYTDYPFSPTMRLGIGFAAIAGHNWPIFLKFKGGKGIATSAGVLVGVAPLTLPPALIAWLVFMLASRYVSLASIAACIAVSASGWMLYYNSDEKMGWIIPGVLTLLGGMGVWRHRANIKRLINGSENRFNFSKKKKNSDDSKN